MLEMINGIKILDINYFAYYRADAEFFLNNLVLAHQQNHLYITQENMRYYVRGIVMYEGDDIKIERYQIAYLADYSDCIKYNPHNFYMDHDIDNSSITYRKVV